MKKTLYKPSRRWLFSLRDWTAFFKKYINSKSVDLPKTWEYISLKILDLMIKEHCVKIPNIGVLEVRIQSPARYVKLKNDKPYFKYPRSQLVFTPDPELKKIFDRKFFAEYEIRELENKTFDWIKKSTDKKRYER